MTAASPADWAAFLSLGTVISAGVSIPFFLLVDADREDFDPRRLLDTHLGARALVEIVRARHTVRDASREAALTTAALLMLLTSAPEATR